MILEWLSSLCVLWWRGIHYDLFIVMKLHHDPLASCMIPTNHRDFLNRLNRKGDCSVGKVLSLQAWGPKFESLTPSKKLGMRHVPAYQWQVGRVKQTLIWLKLKLQVQWETLSQKIKMEDYRERLQTSTIGLHRDTRGCTYLHKCYHTRIHTHTHTHTHTSTKIWGILNLIFFSPIMWT